MVTPASPADAMPLACPHCGHMPAAVVHDGVTTNYEHDFGTLPDGTDCLHAGVIWPEQLAAYNCRPPVDEAAEFRREGWSVAVHNDYRLNGEAHTFWLFTHPSGRFIKGEGRTDAEAFAQCRAALTAGRT